MTIKLKINFQEIKFMLSAAKVSQLPTDEGCEVAFVGRSNSGKSTAINAIFMRRGLAKTSKTPGRTQLINVFSLNDEVRMIDLPGYGFAKVPGQVKAKWTALLQNYFYQRTCLKAVFIMVDIRRGLLELDKLMIDLAHRRGAEICILMTKADKLSRARALDAYKLLKQQSPEVNAIIFSATKNIGIDDARKALLDYLD
jgi:GTP-binding protein